MAQNPRIVNLKSLEWILYSLIWFFLFCLPFFQYRYENQEDWSGLKTEWLRLSAFCILFFLNVLIVVPKVLFFKRYISYLSSIALILTVILGISIYVQLNVSQNEPLAMPKMELGPGMPPMEINSKMVPIGYKAPKQIEKKPEWMIILDEIIIGILVVAAGTTFRLLSQWLNEEGLRKDIEKEQLKTELALLRHQVSPHFFMNTLNNIHALIDINTENAKDAVIRLSTLMRYLLYDTAQGQTSLKKELEFISSYIALMQLRYSSKVKITIDVPEEIPDIQIPPMLFNSIIENAFKHGVSYQKSSFVHFNLFIDNNLIHCIIRNSKHKKNEQTDKKYSGIGMTNIRKSLDLLFKKEYSLEVNETETEFEVKLSIPSV